MVFPDYRWDFSAKVDISLITNECDNSTLQEQIMSSLLQLSSGVFRSLRIEVNYQEYVSPYQRLLTKKGFTENIDNIFSCNLWQSTWDLYSHASRKRGVYMKLCLWIFVLLLLGKTALYVYIMAFFAKFSRQTINSNMKKVLFRRSNCLSNLRYFP